MITALQLSRSRTFAIALIVALLAWSLGVPGMIHKVEADAVEQFSDTLSDSDLGVDAIHTIVMTVPNGMSSNESFRIYFDEAGSNFDFTSVTDADLLGTTTGAGFEMVNTCSGNPSEIDLSIGANYVQGDVCTGDTIASSTTLTFVIGVSEFINNPSTPTSYVIRIEGNGATPILDSGSTRVAIIDNVTVTAAVETIFTFTIAGVASSTTVNDDAVQTSTTTSATAVPFGILAPGVAKVAAQELRVDTNAANGFTVTVEADTTLVAGNGADIDTFIDANSTPVPTAWQSPANTFGDEDTYGHWGLTTDDDDVGSSTLDFGSGSAAYVGDFIVNPIPVFYHGEPVSYTNDPTSGESFTQVGYKIEIDTLQEAADDYSATLTYIATPVF